MDADAVEEVKKIIESWKDQADTCPVPVPLGVLKDLAGEAEVLSCLAGSERFQAMTVSDALEELEANGCGRDNGRATAQPEWDIDHTEAHEGGLSQEDCPVCNPGGES